MASNFHTSEDINSQEKISAFIEEMHRDGVHIEQVDFTRKLSNIRGHIKSYNQVRKLLTRHFDIVHCHAPFCAAITRICAKKYRKSGTKVFYTAHGFHFYDGAPIKNCLIFYPIEKHYSRYTDVLITINKEDYKRASERFHAKKVVYIPGVGVDTEKFTVCKVDRSAKRAEIGVGLEDFVIISVGELNENKNHQEIIRAIEKISNVKYVIVGKGIYEKDLKELANKLGIDKRVIITGYRTDVDEMLGMADCFAFPSRREGLGLASIEALSVGLPLISSRAGGIKDYSIDGVTGYSCDSEDVEGFTRIIKRLISEKYTDKDKWNGYKENNRIVAKKFDHKNCNMRMKKVYESI